MKQVLISLAISYHLGDLHGQVVQSEKFNSLDLPSIVRKKSRIKAGNGLNGYFSYYRGTSTSRGASIRNNW